YRVKLVAVRSLSGREGWWNAGYIDHVWRADYVPATGDSRNRRLQVDIYPGSLHGPGVNLYTPGGASDGGPSPAEPYENSGTNTTMTVSTFDWYVPTRTFAYPLGTAAELAHNRREVGILGGASGGSTSVHAMSPVEVRAVGGVARAGAGGTGSGGSASGGG